MKYRKIPNYGDLMTIEEFKKCVDCGGFIDYDGHGSLSDGKQIIDGYIVYPSMFMNGKVAVGNCWDNVGQVDIPKEATHIVWYNR